MSHKKLKKFAELNTFSNAIQIESNSKGQWRQKQFNNANELILELGCGKGDYTIELAKRFPNRNFIGVDIKGERLWRGAKTAMEENLKNVRFLRIFIDHIPEHFAGNEISEIWITFPDPYPKKRNEKKRLTSPRFLDCYQQILKNGGRIHFKTDAYPLFDYTRNVLKRRQAKIHRIIEDLHKTPVEDELLAIKTMYEKRHIENGKKIYYLCFSL